MDTLNANTQAPVAPPDPLTEFCRRFREENRADWPVIEDKLAAAFLQFFKLDFCPGETLKKLCLELSIQLSEEPLPKGVKGWNHSYHGERTIIIATDQCIPGASFEHTLLHELRELMEYVFCDLGAATVADRAEQEKRAEQFASSVRMTTACNGIVSVFEGIHIETAWKRYLAYLAIAMGGLFYFATCALLPYVEERLSKA